MVRPFPTMPAFIPVMVESVVDLEMDHFEQYDGNQFIRGQARFRMSQKQGDKTVIVHRLDAGTRGGDYKQQLVSADFVGLLWDTVYKIELGAFCAVSSDPLMGYDEIDQTETTQTCSAAADPSIRFDQAGFDALYGPQSFRLADYLALEFSPGISPVPDTPQVPEPGTGLMVAAGVLAYAALRRRRQVTHLN